MMIGYAAAANCGDAVRNCSCGDTLTANHTITALDNLTNCTGAGLIIGANNVVLDCDGSLIQGNLSGFGIFSNAFSVITIQNCRIDNFTTGINIQKANLSNYTHNVITNMSSNGITSQHGWYMNIRDNTLWNITDDGIILTNVTISNLTNNTVNLTGSELIQVDERSSFSNIWNNTLLNGKRLLLFRASFVNLTSNYADNCTQTDGGCYNCDQSNNTIMHDNTAINGLNSGILYAECVTGQVSNNNITCVPGQSNCATGISMNAAHILIDNNIVSNYGRSLDIQRTYNTLINWFRDEVGDTHNFTISNNRFLEINNSGIHFITAYDIIIDNNDVIGNGTSGSYGISMFNTTSVNLSGNNISTVPFGIRIRDTIDGYAQQNTVSSTSRCFHFDNVTAIRTVLNTLSSCTTSIQLDTNTVLNSTNDVFNVSSNAVNSGSMLTVWYLVQVKTTLNDALNVTVTNSSGFEYSEVSSGGSIANRLFVTFQRIAGNPSSTYSYGVFAVRNGVNYSGTMGVENDEGLPYVFLLDVGSYLTGQAQALCQLVPGVGLGLLALALMLGAGIGAVAGLRDGEIDTFFMITVSVIIAVVFVNVIVGLCY